MSRRRLLNFALVLGLADAALLVALLYVAFVDRSDAAVSVLGPIHGAGFLGLLGLTGYGASEGHWGWWYPAAVLVTGGPLGTLLGELLLRERRRDAV